MRAKRLILAAGLLSIAWSAQAVPIDMNISLDSPSTATMTGNFDYDPTTEIYSNLTIVLDGNIGGREFDNVLCEECVTPVPTSGVGLIDPTFSVSWFLTDFDVTWAGGGLRAIFRGGSFTLSDDRGRIGGTYALTAATAVSEPGSIALLLLGVAGLGFAARARRR